MYARVHGSNPGERMRLYWDGNDGPIDEGDILCYDESATVDATNLYESRGVQVVRPETENIPFLAGAVAPGQSLSEAGYVEVVPFRIGVPVKVKVEAENVAVGDLLAPTNDKYTLGTEIDPASYAAGLVDNPVFVALEANPSSAGTNLRLVMLKKG